MSHEPGTVSSRLDTVDSARAACYSPPLIDAVPRLLGQLDRDEHSRSSGSFDREYWAWKFRDFPITMLQTSMLSLAQLWRLPIDDNPYYQNAMLLQWIKKALRHTLARQHRNGAFDSVAPNAHDQGVSLAMCYCCVETAAFLAEALDRQVQAAVRDAVHRAAAFALRDREDYAFISNHRALFALGFLAAYRLTGEARFETSAAETIADILEHQSADGWYEEYGGFDAGYESLGIAYLARYWHDTGRATGDLLASLDRSVAHFAYAVHPDGSVGGDYGSRNTRLYFPSGFELLSGALPMASAVARFLRGHLDEKNVVTPATADSENLPILTHSYLEACRVTGPDGDDRLPGLPCETLDGVHLSTTLGAAGSLHYYAVLGIRKGTVHVFHRASRTLVYEDAGYTVLADGKRWSPQALGTGRAETTEERTVVCHGRMGEVLQLLPTPVRFVALRILGLTVFRSATLARLIRRWIVRRLVTHKRPGPFQVRRAFHFEEDRIRVLDTLTAESRTEVTHVDLPRQLQPFHMGSARYFHPSELLPLPRIQTDSLRDALNRGESAQQHWSLQFHASGAELAVPQGSDAVSQPPPQPL